MAYDSATLRADASVLVPQELSNEVIKEAAKQSMVMGIFKRVPVMTNAKTIPVMSALPTAYFISPTDVGLAQTTKQVWGNVSIAIEEAAVIAPMPRSVVEDVATGGFNLTQEMVPYLAEAVGVLIDTAVLFGTGKPSSWPTAVVTAAGALATPNTYTRGTTSAPKGGLAEDINQLMRKMAAQGFRPNAFAARSTMEYDLDGARDANGQKLLDVQTNSFRGRPIMYGGDGVFPADTGQVADMIVLDQAKFVFGIRREMEVTLHTEGVITNAEGAVQYNLMQQNAIAVRVTIRCGWAVGNPVTRAQSDATLRYPAGVLLSPAV